MNTNKKILGSLALIVIAGAAILIAYNYLRRVPQPLTEVQVSVRMKWFPSGTMSGWYAGKEQGFFKEQGIDLTINPGGPDNNSIKLVAAGTDLFGVSGADEVLIAREKGIPIVPIAVLFKESPIAFISKKNSGIERPEQWTGKKIEVDFGSNAEIQFRALVKKFNVKDVKEQPYTFSLVPFIDGKVDVSVAYVMDQVVTLKKQGVDVNVVTAKEYGINPYGDVIITTEKTLKENPELIKKFLTAVIKSQKWAIENKALAVDALVKNADTLKKDNELSVWEATIPFLISTDGIDNIGKMNNSRWDETQNILLEFQALKQKQTISF